MKYAARLRGALLAALLSSAASTGCIHNHYYTGVPGCPPGTIPISAQSGTTVCDVPSGQVVVSTNTVPAGSISSNVVVPPSPTAATPAPRVVISQPTYGYPYGPGLSRFKWRRPDPENVASMRTEGALSDEPTTYK